MFKPAQMRRVTRGFTLIEIMIALVIVSILAAIAIPSYRESVAKSRRSETRVAMAGLQHALERYFTNYNTYANTTNGAGTAVTSVNTNGTPAIYSSTVPVGGGTATYNLTVAITNAGADYTITATRITTGSQKNDKCGDYTLTAAGVRGLINNTKTVADCW